MRRILTGILSLCLSGVLLVPLPAMAAGQQSGATELNITVPDAHEVQLIIEEHGLVTVNGKNYRGNQAVDVKRQSEQKYMIQADTGWQVDTVSYGPEKEQTKVTLEASGYTAPPINADGNILCVTFKKAADSGRKSTPSSLSRNYAKGVQPLKTGDSANAAGIFTVLLVSGLAVTGLSSKVKRYK